MRQRVVHTTNGQVSLGKASALDSITSDYYVASYTEHETKVLSKASASAVPQVDGHLLAWINLLGQLKARAIKLPK